ncbi:MAG: STAS domain-containing protein [Planctomycetota bacterium]
MVPPSTPAVLSWPAEVTTESVASLEREAGSTLGPTGTALVVDLTRTTFLSSSGLGLLVRTGKMLAERGGGLAVAHPQPGVARLLRAVGLDAVIPSFSSVEAARTHLRKPTGR